MYFFSCEFSRYLFVGDGGKTPKILRCGLTGDNCRSAISQGILNPVSIAVDVDDRTLVWVDDARDTLEVAAYDGTERRVILSRSPSTFLDVAVFKVITLS